MAKNHKHFAHGFQKEEEEKNLKNLTGYVLKRESHCFAFIVVNSSNMSTQTSTLNL
jgi:hypothetical protein